MSRSRARELWTATLLVCLAGCDGDAGVQRLEREIALAREDLRVASASRDSLDGEVRARRFREQCASAADPPGCWHAVLWTDVDYLQICDSGQFPEVCTLEARLRREITDARDRWTIAERELSALRGGDP